MNNSQREIMAQVRGFYDREASTVETLAADYTAVLGDRSKLLRFTADATLSLTAAATLTNGWFAFVSAVGVTVTVDPDGSETIDGESTLTIPDGTTARIFCDGSAFYTLGTPGTDLTIENRGESTLDVASSTGDNATVPAATSTQAGLMSAARFSRNIGRPDAIYEHRTSGDGGSYSTTSFGITTYNTTIYSENNVITRSDNTFTAIVDCWVEAWRLAVETDTIILTLGGTSTGTDVIDWVTSFQNDNGSQTNQIFVNGFVAAGTIFNVRARVQVATGRNAGIDSEISTSLTNKFAQLKAWRI